jgi:hypothetical protein
MGSNNNFQTDNAFKDMIQPFELQNKVITLQEKLPSILEDFKKYYVFYNKNPTYSEYQTIYQNIVSNINSLASDLISISTETEKNVQTISDVLIKINTLIENEKNKNNELKSIESNINNQYNGSKIMVYEYKQIYNENYIKNIFMFFGIIISGTILIKVFTKKVAQV